MTLIEPSLKFIESYRSALIEFENHGISGFWRHFGPIHDAQDDLVRITHYQHVTGLPNSVVPASVYWLVDMDEFVGHVSIRHALDASLEQRGGHIGYAIRPSKHRMGYGSQILRLVLPHARILGISSALVTCDKDNIGSRKIIEKNGGVFSNELQVNGKAVLHFRIRL